MLRATAVPASHRTWSTPGSSCLAQQPVACYGWLRDGLHWRDLPSHRCAAGKPRAAAGAHRLRPVGRRPATLRGRPVGLATACLDDAPSIAPDHGDSEASGRGVDFSPVIGSFARVYSSACTALLQTMDLIMQGLGQDGQALRIANIGMMRCSTSSHLQLRGRSSQQPEVLPARGEVAGVDIEEFASKAGNHWHSHLQWCRAKLLERGSPPPPSSMTRSPANASSSQRRNSQQQRPRGKTPPAHQRRPTPQRRRAGSCT